MSDRYQLTLHAMGARIGAVLEERDITQAEFCRRVGVSTKHLNEVIHGKVTAHPSKLDYWAWILGLQWTVDLVSQNGDDPVEPVGKSAPGDLYPGRDL